MDIHFSHLVLAEPLCFLLLTVGQCYCGSTRFSLKPSSIHVNSKSSVLLWGQGGKGRLTCRSLWHQCISEGACKGVSKNSFWQYWANVIQSRSLQVAAWLFFQLTVLWYF